MILAVISFSPGCMADQIGNSPDGSSSDFAAPYGGIRGVNQETANPNGGQTDAGLRAPVSDFQNQNTIPPFSDAPLTDTKSKHYPKVKKDKSAMKKDKSAMKKDKSAMKKSKSAMKKDKSGGAAVVGMPDRAAKTGVGMTDRTAKTGIGLTDRAVKTGVGAPCKAVKETLKAIF
jgi:hypothetical protein